MFKSFHGREFGFESPGGGLRGSAFGGKPGVMINQRFVKRITSALLLALNATPQTVIAAPGAGLYIRPTRWAVYKPAGTAYAGIAAGEDLVLKYTNAAGVQIASPIETTGFLDSAAAQVSFAGCRGTADNATPASVLAALNAPVVIQLLTGEITTGTSDIYVEVIADICDGAFTL